MIWPWAEYGEDHVQKEGVKAKKRVQKGNDGRVEQEVVNGVSTGFLARFDGQCGPTDVRLIKTCLPWLTKEKINRYWFGIAVDGGSRPSFKACR